MWFITLDGGHHDPKVADDFGRIFGDPKAMSRCAQKQALRHVINAYEGLGDGEVAAPRLRV